MDGCGVSLWETEAVLGAVYREVFFVLDRNLQLVSWASERPVEKASLEHKVGSTRRVQLVPCQALMLGLSEVVRGSLAAAKPACQPPNQNLTQH